MARFHETLIAENAELLKQACEHPFLRSLADGTITDEQFLRWLSQDYLWVREFEQALAILASRAPREMRRPFFESLLNLHAEVELFEETAARAGIDLLHGEMCVSCHAYASFLLATAVAKSFEEAIMAFYASELTYLEAWSFVKRSQKQKSPWQEFIDLWTHEGFRQWVETIAKCADEIADSASPATRERMARTFRMGLRYERIFWDVAIEKPRG